MKDRLIKAAAKTMGYQVNLSDFVPCGLLRATETGLDVCRTYGFAHTLMEITEGDKLAKTKTLTGNARKKVHDALDRSFLFAAIAVCTDEAGKAEATDADMIAFIEKNRAPLARLIGAAYITNFPGIMEEFGISA